MTEERQHVEHWARLVLQTSTTTLHGLYSGSRPTYFSVKVGLGELQRVEQSIGCGEFDVVARLLLPHSLDDGCQNLVGVIL